MTANSGAAQPKPIALVPVLPKFWPFHQPRAMLVRGRWLASHELVDTIFLAATRNIVARGFADPWASAGRSAGRHRQVPLVARLP